MHPTARSCATLRRLLPPPSYHCKEDTVWAAVERCGGTRAEFSTELPTWSFVHLHRVVAHFLRIRFPIHIALNKVRRSRRMVPCDWG